MNRRELLRLLTTGLVGYQLDLDRLLWIPGAKKIFLPSPKIKLGTINFILKTNFTIEDATKVFHECMVETFRK